MNDIKKYFKENMPQVGDSEQFIRDIERQLDLLPAKAQMELLEAERKRSLKVLVLEVLSVILVSVLLCLLALVVIQNTPSLTLSTPATTIIISVIFSSSTLIQLCKQWLVD